MSDPTLPSRRYADGVARGDWQQDPAQQPALRTLDRIHAGTFGTCVKCGEPIAIERLNAVPHTPFCQACAAAH